MVHRGGRHPHRVGVTSLANIGGRNMCCTLARGDNTIVTSHTAADDFGMIHHRDRYPHRRVVAGFTNIRGIDVSRGFSGG